MATSILNNVKKILGMDSTYTAFDQDIITHINTVFADLQSMGVGPQDGFSIENSTPTWEDYTAGNMALNQVKTYMYLRVRMIFDPPATSYTQDAFNRQIQELAWRLHVTCDISGTGTNSSVVVLDGGTP